MLGLFRVSLPFRTVAQTVSLQLWPLFLSMKGLVRGVTRVRFGDRAFAAGTRKPLSSSRASHIGDLGEESALSRPSNPPTLSFHFDRVVGQLSISELAQMTDEE